MRAGSILVLCGCMVASPLARPRADDAVSPPRSPADALTAFTIKPGLRIECVAAEPLVQSPVAIDFGADGKLWVCEMRDYPMGLDGNWKPGGVIKYLEDRDGDGRYDRATEFLQDVPFPTGVMAWRKGVLVCAAPEIVYAEDTDGDGKADLKRTLFAGFATANYQARVNGLSYNLDNWVYGANGLIGGSIRGVASGRTVDIGGRDFRMNPDTGAFEPAAGLTQQGRVHDDWGNQFGGNNGVLLQHYPLADHYARRNPFVAAPAAAVLVARGPDHNRLFPTSRTLERFNRPESANRVTSACGPLIYRDEFLGAEYEGNAFVCEPVHNLVHREVLSAEGITFASHRAADEQASEFLSSTDHWFRPVQVRDGPNGALWVVDMYRFVIEHPRWISPERLAQLDVRAGHDKGRIYRIVPADRPPRAVPVLETLATPALAERLDDPSGTLRDNVQRVLVHRADRSAVRVLERLAAASPRAATRAQALWTLEGLGALRGDVLRHALADAHAGVRRQAVRIAESRLETDAAVAAALLPLVDDPDLPVRFQLALALGAWKDTRAGDALARLADSAGRDAWLRAAILSAAVPHGPRILRAAIARDRPDRTLVSGLLATIVGTKDRQAIDAAAQAVLGSGGGAAPWRYDALARLLRADAAAPFTRGAAFRALRQEAVRLVTSDDEPSQTRAAAVELFGWDAAERTNDETVLDTLLEPRQPAAVRRAALQALGRIRTADADAVVLRHWPQLEPALRQVALDQSLARPDATERFIAAVERGAIAPSEIDAAHRERLLNHPDARLRERSVRAFGRGRPESRERVLAAYRAALPAQGDPARGKRAFAKICATCHRYDGQGHEVGPDLAALTDRSPEAFLVAILDPNREVDARYASYTAALADGRVLNGLIASETGNAVTLKRQEGAADVVLRAEIDELKTAGLSLMPEGLEHDLTPADMADLVAYLVESGPRPKSIAGNQPRTVAQAAGGTIRLAADSAAIYGPSLTFEPELGNLGYWHSVDDHASWSFRVERAGTYTVTMEWACADEAAGNGWLLQLDAQTLRGKVGGTAAGSWSQYRSLFIGELSLTPGVHHLHFRPAGAVREALLDLRALVLTPRLAIQGLP